MILKEMLSKIALHEVDNGELLSLLKEINKDEVNRMNALSGQMRSLLDVFKPVSNTPHPLMSPKLEDTSSDIDNTVNNMSADQMNMMFMFFTKFQDALKSVKEEEKEQEE